MRKTRLCSLLLAFSMVLSMAVLFVTPAMAAEGSTPAKAPVASVDFSNKTFWKGDTATSFNGGTGTEAHPFQIATADQLAYLSQLTSTNAEKLYLLLGENSTLDEGTVFSTEYYTAYKLTEGGNDYYIAVVDGVNYLFCTTNGSTTTYTVTLGTSAFYYYVDVSGNEYFTTEIPGVGAYKGAYVYDEASGKYVSSSRIYQYSEGLYGYGANTNASKKVPLTWDGIKYTKLTITVAEDATHILSGKEFLARDGVSVKFTDDNGDILYGFTNRDDILQNPVYKVTGANAPVKEGTNYTINGTLLDEVVTVNSIFYAHYKLAADLYLNDPTPYLDHWDDDVTANSATIEGARKDFVIDKDNEKLHFSKAIATAGNFRGHFDGDGHTIFGFAAYGSDSSASNKTGLFAGLGTQATVCNLNMAYASLYMAWNDTGSGLYGMGVICAKADGTSIVLDNCHVLSSNLYSNQIVGGLVGYCKKSCSITISNSSFNGNINLINVKKSVSGAGGICGKHTELDPKVTIENCTVSGLIKTDKAADSDNNNIQVAGIMCTGDNRASVIIRNCVNYADVVSTTGAGAGGIAGELGYTSTGGLQGIVVSNCINYGDVTSATGPAGGGFAKLTINANLNKYDTAIYGFRAFNFANYGTIKGANAGQIGGIFGYGTPAAPGTNSKFPNTLSNINGTFEARNCILAGKAEASTEDGVAGAVIGYVKDGGYVSPTNYSSNVYQMILDHVYYKGNSELFGHESAELTAYLADETYADYYKNVEPLTDMDTAMGTLNEHIQVCSSGCAAPVKYSWTPLPWSEAASTIKAASLELGNTIAINLYAQPDHLTIEGLDKMIVTQEGVTKALLSADADMVTVGGVDYLHYQLPVKSAEIGASFVFFLNGGKITYSVLDYATRKYNSNSTEGLNELLEAIVHYGNAAQAAKGVTPTVLDTFAAETGYAYEGDYIADKYADVHFMNNESTFPEGVAVSLALTDGITPVIYVNNSDITHISYTCYEETTEQDIAGETYVSLDKLVATSLNNPVTITFTVAGEEVTGTWNVADFIVAATEVNGFTAEQVTLAHALAVYMTTARAYKGLKN